VSRFNYSGGGTGGATFPDSIVPDSAGAFLKINLNIQLVVAFPAKNEYGSGQSGVIRSPFPSNCRGGTPRAEGVSP